MGPLGMRGIVVKKKTGEAASLVFSEELVFI
jgi:hypothetical protein